MAGGRYGNRSLEPDEPLFEPVARRTRALEESIQIQQTDPSGRTTRFLGDAYVTEVLPETPMMLSESARNRPNRVVEIPDRHELTREFQRHGSWLRPLLICMLLVVLGGSVLLMASAFQRPSDSPQIVTFSGGGAYSVQVGGSVDKVSTWQKSDKPLPIKKDAPPVSKGGAYAVLNKPTVTVDFINKVLDAYHSPAAGKGKTLYDLGVKYEIDPAVALAFFLHESTMGTQGEARVTFSLGNIRCTKDFPCPDGYSHYPSWEVGFEEWYKLIRNLYVAQLDKTTFETIIPTYAPQADNNDEKAYIDSLKHSLDIWHSGELVVN